MRQPRLFSTFLKNDGALVNGVNRRPALVVEKDRFTAVRHPSYRVLAGKTELSGGRGVDVAEDLHQDLRDHGRLEGGPEEGGLRTTVLTAEHVLERQDEHVTLLRVERVVPLEEIPEAVVDVHLDRDEPDDAVHVRPEVQDEVDHLGRRPGQGRGVELQRLELLERSDAVGAHHPISAQVDVHLADVEPGQSVDRLPGRELLQHDGGEVAPGVLGHHDRVDVRATVLAHRERASNADLIRGEPIEREHPELVDEVLTLRALLRIGVVDVRRRALLRELGPEGVDRDDDGAARIDEAFARLAPGVDDVDAVLQHRDELVSGLEDVGLVLEVGLGRIAKGGEIAGLHRFYPMRMAREYRMQPRCKTTRWFGPAEREEGSLFDYFSSSRRVCIKRRKSDKKRKALPLQ